MREGIKRAIDAAYHNRNLIMPEIAAIANRVREEYGIDAIYLVTNREYKYQLNHVLTCRAKGMKFLQPKSWVLTREHYQKIVEEYLETPVSVRKIPELDQLIGGDYIHAGILRGQGYFGTMVFWNAKKRDWTQEEKEVLEALCGLCLIFIGLNNMVQGLTQYGLARQKMENRRVLTGMFLNLESGKCHLVKLAPFLEGEFKEWEDYEVFLNHYIHNYMDSVYGKQLAEMCGLEPLRKNLSPDCQSLLLEYPRESDGEVNWIRFWLECNTFREDGTPRFATIRFLDINREMKREAYLSSATELTRNTYMAIASVSLENGRYAIYVDNRKDVVSGKSPYGDYSELHRELLENCVPKDYAEVFNRMFREDCLKEHFRESKASLQFEFPCRFGGETGWVRLEAARSPGFEDNGKRVLLYYSDVTEQKNRELQMEKRTRDLEKTAMERQEQAEHDSLTGVYNRRGYTTVLERFKKDVRTCAYLQVDVDNFKVVNDTYGHAFGDEVLKTVAKVLKESFREEDYVFRFGGDEFAVLLVNCSNDAWATISEKQERMHARINRILQKDWYLTLSIGGSWSAYGFVEEMVSVADTALYCAKAKGRAGCCVFNEERKVVYEWRDPLAKTLCRRMHTLLEQRNTGFCTMELPDGKLEHARLTCNETARLLMGFTKEMTPEECFSVWLDRVDPKYRVILKRTRAALIDKGRAECTYRYHHPQWGDILVRSGGCCEMNEQGILLSGYHQSLQDMEVVHSSESES